VSRFNGYSFVDLVFQLNVLERDDNCLISAYREHVKCSID